MRRKLVFPFLFSSLLVMTAMVLQPISSQSLNSLQNSLEKVSGVHNINTGLSYGTIQEAINAPETLDGRTLILDTEVFYEHVVVNKSVQLYGSVWIEHPEIIPTINGNGAGTVVTIRADNVTMNLIKITNGMNGVRLEEADGCMLAYLSVVDNAQTGIYLEYSSNNTISRNTIANNYEGVSLMRSGSNIFKNNNITGNYYGFSVWGVALSDFFNDVDHSNTINKKPIYYWVNHSNEEIPADAGFVAIINSTNILVSNLTLTKNTQGILFAFTEHSTIENLNISNNMYGIVLWRSLSNTIWDNTISSNLYHGISMSLSNNNTGSVNSVSDNQYGIYLDGSFNNRFCHNNFIDNIQHVYVRISMPNFWDNSVEGNYWSDYIRADSDNDGLDDSWYEIDQNNIDHYPLMGLFHSFNTSLGYSVNVISNSTIEDFEFFESNSTINMYVSNMTSDQTFGFCRVCIPHILINEPYHVTVNGTEPYYWNYTLYDDGDKRWIYFSYQHSTLEIIIISEFPQSLIPPLFMIATLLTVTFYRRKHSM